MHPPVHAHSTPLNRSYALAAKSQEPGLSPPTEIGHINMDEIEIKPLEKFTASPYRQDIELQHVTHRADYVTLRVRIREIKRFTIFDIDERTARLWGEAMLNWADTLGKTGGQAPTGEEK
jgi:hypothetical protein